MSNILNWITFPAALLLIAAYGGSEAQPAKTPPPAWDATKTRQEVEADIAWMRRMNAVEAEQAARDAKAAKEFEEADRSDWHPPYEPAE